MADGGGSCDLRLLLMWQHQPTCLQANLSPNLSSGHFTDNRFLYEQVLSCACVMAVACKQTGFNHNHFLKANPITFLCHYIELINNHLEILGITVYNKLFGTTSFLVSMYSRNSLFITAYTRSVSLD